MSSFHQCSNNLLNTPFILFFWSTQGEGNPGNKEIKNDLFLRKEKRKSESVPQMEQEIVAPWKQEDLVNVPKKELIEFLKKNGSNEFLHRHALQGKIQNVIKAVNKAHICHPFQPLQGQRGRCCETASTDLYFLRTKQMQLTPICSPPR